MSIFVITYYGIFSGLEKSVVSREKTGEYHPQTTFWLEQHFETCWFDVGQNQIIDGNHAFPSSAAVSHPKELFKALRAYHVKRFRRLMSTVTIAWLQRRKLLGKYMPFVELDSDRTEEFIIQQVVDEQLPSRA